MPKFRAAAALLALAACSTPGNMTPLNPEVDLKGYAAYSWGLADVSREHYDDVAIECTARATLTGVTPKSDVSIPNSGPIGTEAGGTAQVDPFLIDRAGLEEQAQKREERRQRQAIMDKCLAEFGFVKFGLTKEQADTLATLPHGDPKRREYLHRLASDPEVLRKQAI